MAIVGTPDTWPINSQTKHRRSCAALQIEIAVSPDIQVQTKNKTCLMRI